VTSQEGGGKKKGKGWASVKSVYKMTDYMQNAGTSPQEAIEDNFTPRMKTGGISTFGTSSPFPWEIYWRGEGAGGKVIKGSTGILT